MVTMTPVAPYQRVRQYVVRLINASNGKSEQIMSEIQLSKIFKVSRTTVRKALRDLIDEGRLIVKPGLGTFINPILSSYDMSAGHKYCNSKIHVWGVVMHYGHQVHWTYYDQGFFCGLFSVTSELPVYISPITLAYSDKNMIQEITSLKLDGLFLINSKSKALPYLEELKDELDIICVDYEEKPSWPHEIIVDFFDFGYAAAAKLIESGSKKPLFIEEGEDSPYSLRTLEGFREGFKRHGINIDERLILWKENYKGKLTAMIEFNIEFDSVFTTPHVYSSVVSLLRENNLQDIQIITEASPICSCTEEMCKTVYFKRPWSLAGKCAGEKIKTIISGNKYAGYSEKIPWTVETT